MHAICGVPKGMANKATPKSPFVPLLG